MSSEKPAFGLILFEDAFDSRELSTDSVYTEASPLPGRATSGDSSVYAVGAQSQAIDVIPVRGGFPGRRGAAITYRLAGVSGDDRSWNTPAVIEDVTSPAWGAAAAWTTPAIVGSPKTGLVYVAATNGSAEGKVWSLDPRAASPTWTAELALTGVADGATGRWATLAVDPDAPDGIERVIATWSGQGGQYLSSVYRIDPDGTYLYARAPWPVDIGSQPRIAAAPGGDWIALEGINGQLASSDRGATWDVVDAAFDATYSDVCALPAGGFLVTARDGSGDATVRLLASARGALSSVGETVFTGSAVSARVLCAADEAGILYALLQNDGILALRVSYNGGVTWVETIDPVIDQGGASAANEARWHGLTAACGALWLVGTGPSSSAATDGAIVVLRLGGWSTVEQGAPIEESQTKHESRFGYGAASGTAYVPTDLPQNVGWTRSAAGGTQSLDEADVRLRVTATQLQNEQYTTSENLGVSAGDCAVFRLLLRVSATTPDADLASNALNNGIRFATNMDDGADAWKTTLKAGPDGIRLQMSALGGALLGSAAIDGTIWTHVLIFQHESTVTAWYSQSTGPVLVWTRFVNAAAVTAIITSTTRLASLQWGHETAAIAGTADLYVRLAAFAPGANVRYLSGVSDPDDSPATGVRSIVFGRPVPGRPGAICVPDLTEADEAVGYLSAEGGPLVLRADTFALTPDHVYPAHAAGPLSVPAPRRPWRGLDTSETAFVWEHVEEEAPYVGAAVALLALRAAPAVWTLERDDGSGAAWSTVGTLDLRLDGGPLAYSRSGAVIRPSAGTASVPHYIAEGSLAGGYVIDATAGIAREITSNTGGYWTEDATKQRVSITLAGVRSSDPASGSALSIVSPRGLLVVYLATDDVRTRWRVRATAGQTTPYLRYEAGILAPGRVIGVGGEPSWSWGVQHSTARRVTVGADGHTSIRQLGPPARVLTYSWSDALPAILVHRPEYATPVAGTGLPIGTWQDAPWSLPAALASSRSGERPVVAVPRLPAGPTTLRRLEDFVYGTLTGDLTRGGVGGTEGLDEAQTIGDLIVREIT